MLSLLFPMALAASVFALPTTSSITLTASSILQVAPGTLSCTHAPALAECRTASQAAPWISSSFSKFQIADFHSQAAILTNILFESGGFNYFINHFPGVPGQGTRNMQAPEYNLEYAQWLAKVCKNCCVTPDQVQVAASAGPAAVLELVNTEQWSFSSAAWFLSAHCSDGVREQLATGTVEGWQAYMVCVHAADDPKRDQIWRSVVALGRW